MVVPPRLGLMVNRCASRRLNEGLGIDGQGFGGDIGQRRGG